MLPATATLESSVGFRSTSAAQTISLELGVGVGVAVPAEVADPKICALCCVQSSNRRTPAATPHATAQTRDRLGDASRAMAQTIHAPSAAIAAAPKPTPQVETPAASAAVRRGGQTQIALPSAGPDRFGGACSSSGWAFSPVMRASSQQR